MGDIAGYFAIALVVVVCTAFYATGFIVASNDKSADIVNGEVTVKAGPSIKLYQCKEVE
jgi:hypothetical protein